MRFWNFIDDQIEQFDYRCITLKPAHASAGGEGDHKWEEANIRQQTAWQSHRQIDRFHNNRFRNSFTQYPFCRTQRVPPFRRERRPSATATISQAQALFQPSYSNHVFTE